MKPESVIASIALFVLALILVAIFATPQADGGVVKLACNPSAGADKYRFWLDTQLLAESNTPEATVVLPDFAVSKVTVTAINNTGESEHSAMLALLAVVVQCSPDNRVWSHLRTVYVEVTNTQFFRLTPPSHNL